MGRKQLFYSLPEELAAVEQEMMHDFFRNWGQDMVHRSVA
jgi:hypothetical protein